VLRVEVAEPVVPVAERLEAVRAEAMALQQAAAEPVAQQVVALVQAAEVVLRVEVAEPVVPVVERLEDLERAGRRVAVLAVPVPILVLPNLQRSAGSQ